MSYYTDSDIQLTQTFAIRFIEFMSSGYYFHLTAELLDIYVKDAVKSNILTEYLKQFWFAVLINGHKPEFQFTKSSKDATFGQCFFLPSLLCYEQNQCAERTLQHL